MEELKGSATDEYMNSNQILLEGLRKVYGILNEASDEFVKDGLKGAGQSPQVLGVNEGEHVVVSQEDEADDQLVGKASGDGLEMEVVVDVHQEES